MSLAGLRAAKEDQVGILFKGDLAVLAHLETSEWEKRLMRDLCVPSEIFFFTEVWLQHLPGMASALLALQGRGAHLSSAFWLQTWEKPHSRFRRFVWNGDVSWWCHFLGTGSGMAQLAVAGVGSASPGHQTLL